MSEVLTIDVSGDDGKDGVDGQDGTNGLRGSHGEHGEDATEPRPGRDGGRIEIALGSEVSDDDVDEHSVVADIQVWRHREESPEETVGFALSELPQFELVARGGDGGDGGRGGNGGDGGRGRSGEDATRMRSGTNGGPGGDGGDGGRGSSGADGGDGGTITVEVDERDSYLLMAVAESAQPESLVSGGDGGSRGEHGVGGSGGPGGPGGSSHSWTERDSDGNRRRRRNSGGRRGRDGRDGQTPTTRLREGSPGRSGEFQIRVRRPDGYRDFSDRYDLEVTGFDYVETPSCDDDGIFEFGQELIVRDLHVENVGSMPTPPHQRIRVEVVESDWIEPVDGQALWIEDSIAPGEVYEVSGSMRFRLAVPDEPPVGEALVVTEPIRPMPVQLGPTGLSDSDGSPFEWPYENSEYTRPIAIRYPVESPREVDALQSLAHGERTRQIFEVENTTNESIGTESPRERGLAVQIEWCGGAAAPEDVILIDDDGREVALDGEMDGFSGYFRPISELDAESSTTIDTEVGFRDSVAPYESATLRFTIWLEHIDGSGRWHPVQRRELTLRLEPAFSYRSDAQLLLVANHNTDRDAFLAWCHVLEEALGLETDYWSISRYGHFDHDIELDDDRPLRAHLQDRLVVVLNQHFEPRPGEETDLPTDYMQAGDVRKSTASGDTRYLIVGERDFELKQWLEPNAPTRKGGEDFESVSEFLKQRGESTDDGGGTAGEEISSHFDVVDVDAWSFPFFRPPFTRIYERAETLQEKLDEAFPHRRYVVVCDPLEPAERDGRIWCGFPRWNLGRLEVRRTLDLEQSEIVTLEAADDDINDESFITGRQLRYALSLALPFDEKLSRLNWLLDQTDDELTDPDHTFGPIVEAIVVELTAEQEAVRVSGDEMDEQRFGERLANFRQLIQYPFYTDMPADSVKWEYLFELCASIEAMTEVQDGGWIFRRRDRKITRYVLEKMEEFKPILFDGHTIDSGHKKAMDAYTASDEIDDIRKLKVAQVRELYKNQSWRERWSNRLRHVGREFFQNPVELADRVERDIDCWLDAKERVWRVEQLEDAQQKEKQRRRIQQQLRERNTDTRSDLLVSGPEAKTTDEADTGENAA